MSNYHPINLYYILQKIASKALVNRFQEVLNVCIDEAQSVFVSGRLISNIIVVAYEVLHIMKHHRSGKEGTFPLKLNMSKAYNRVELGFIQAMLLKLGFSSSWVRNIMRFITSVSHSVIQNGMVWEWFRPFRGLRQGDPLSPCPFLICGEGLSALLRKTDHEGRVKGVRVARGALRITHLLFVDNSLISGDATPLGARIFCRY